VLNCCLFTTDFFIGERKKLQGESSGKAQTALHGKHGIGFYILLTVHLDVILVNNQLDTLFLNVFISCPPEYVIPDDIFIQFGPPDDEHFLLETCTGIK
jgi:hypothetical protein